MLHAIIRSPKLCDLYSKQERKIMTEKQIEQANKEAFTRLRFSNINESNATGQITSLCNSVNEALNFKYDESSPNEKKRKIVKAENISHKLSLTNSDNNSMKAMEPKQRYKLDPATLNLKLQ